MCIHMDDDELIDTWFSEPVEDKDNPQAIL